MTDAHRDDVIDRWLKRATAGVAGPGPNAACLDAEVMAAWADGGLSDEALRVMRAHVADCARCQVLAAVMTKLEPVGAAAATPAPARRWFLWVGPLAAAAGALALWVFIPRQSPNLGEQAAPMQIAQERAAQAPPTAPPAAQAPRPAEEGALRQKPAAPKLKAEQQGGLDLKRQVNEKDAREANVARADPQRDRAAAAAEPKKADARLAAPAAAPPPTVGMAQAAADRAGAAAGRGGGGLADAGARREQVMAGSRLSKEIVSTDQSVRWRISGGSVEKTTDGGRTWAPVTTGVSAEFTAGASPVPTTCWLVGRAGVVLLTTDGETWKRVSFSEVTDLSAVRATDGRTATVTTADGREFSTIDGGNTWVRRLLQEN